MAHRELVIGIEGGGTKTIAWLSSRDPAEPAGPLGHGKAGPSNVRTVGFETATSNLDLAIQHAFEHAKMDRGPVASVCVGLAGADRDAERVPLYEWATRKHLGDRILVTNDAIPLIYAGFDDGIGVALIAGTGSVAFGRNASGDVARCGGWGPWFGDEGSGYAIALSGLRAVARAADGRGPKTVLHEIFVQAFQIHHASELIPAIYAPTVDRTQIATRADLVFAAAATGDEVANSILNDAAGELAHTVASVVSQLQFGGSPIPLAFTGGVLLGQETYRTRLLARLSEQGLQLETIELVQHAVAGAVRMARSNLG